MPPKMLTSTAATGGPANIASRAACATSERAPPPMSQKSAALPPAAAIWSMVLITSPAPLPMTPMSPSSGTNARPAARALASRSSSGGSGTTSGCRKKAFSSTVTLLSRQTISPLVVRTSGFTSTSVASWSWYSFQSARATDASVLPAPVPPGSSGPNAAASTTSRTWYSRRPSRGSMGRRRSDSGARFASSSMSTPPSREKMSSGLRTSRETVIARYSSRAMSTARSTSTDSTAWPLIVIARISSAAASTSAALPQTRMPPALPRPPVLACALTHTCGPSCSAARRASAGVRATNEGSTGRPTSAKSFFPSCSSRSMAPPSLRGPARG